MVFVDIWPKIASIMAEDAEEAKISVEETEVEDELNLEEGEVMMQSWHRKRRKKKILQRQMVRWAKPISKSRLMECQWSLILITELSQWVDRSM